MRRLTTSRPLFRANPRRKAGASRTSATSPRATVPRAAGTGRRRTASGEAARVPAVTNQALSWTSRTPTEASWWLPSRAVTTASSATPSCWARSGTRATSRARSWPPSSSTRATPGTAWSRGTSTCSAWSRRRSESVPGPSSTISITSCNRPEALLTRGGRTEDGKLPPRADNRSDTPWRACQRSVPSSSATTT